MASSSGHEVSGQRLERFDGSDPGSYKRWRRRAALVLIALPSTYPKEKLGPRLMESLAGEAELACEHLKVEDLAKGGGEQLIFKVLDERFKPLEKEDMREALNQFFFETSIRSGESMKAFPTKFATCYRKLVQQEVELPSQVQEWFLLRNCA